VRLTHRRRGGLGVWLGIDVLRIVLRIVRIWGLRGVVDRLEIRPVVSSSENTAGSPG
jgi:hypothetical protein